jgi:hypothetical protein
MFSDKRPYVPAPGDLETTAWESSLLELPGPPPSVSRARRMIPFAPRSLRAPLRPTPVVDSHRCESVACIPGEKGRHERKVPGG